MRIRVLVGCGLATVLLGGTTALAATMAEAMTAHVTTAHPMVGQPLAMASLSERWRDRAAGDVLQSFTIITTVPNELCAPICRMPAILTRDAT